MRSHLSLVHRPRPRPLPALLPLPTGAAEALLRAHVPLSLLLDLADPSGPQSRDLLRQEAGQADWLVA